MVKQKQKHLIKCLMEQSSSLETDYRSTNQDISSSLTKHEGSLPYSQEPTTGLCPKPDESTSHPVFKPILILPFHLRIDILNGIFLSGVQLKCMYF
jgi:hypothetical protein